jgi:acyl-CoA thioesterase I
VRQEACSCRGCDRIRIGRGRDNRAPTQAAAWQGRPPAPLPADLTRLDLTLKRTARRLASRQLMMIVALGSSSTAGAGASSDAATYPSRLMVELARRFRTQPIIVLNRGISGERAVDMLARFDESVAAERPDLVLWQSARTRNTQTQS